MFTSFNYLPQHRHKSELNPIKGMVVFNMINGERHRIVTCGSKEFVPVYRLQLAVSTDTPIRKFKAPDFWEYFTTRENNLK